MYNLLIGNENLNFSGMVQNIKGIHRAINVFKKHYGKPEYILVSEIGVAGNVIAVTNLTGLQ